MLLPSSIYIFTFMDQILKNEDIKKHIQSFTVATCGDNCKCLWYSQCACGVIMCHLHAPNTFGGEQCAKCFESRYLVCDKCHDKKDQTRQACSRCQLNCCPHQIGYVSWRLKKYTNHDRVCSVCDHDISETPGYSSWDDEW